MGEWGDITHNNLNVKLKEKTQLQMTTSYIKEMPGPYQF